MKTNSKLIGIILLFMIPITFIGFYGPYFSQFPSFQEVKTNFIHIHALIASLWLALLITQPFLIHKKQYNWHRKLGRFSYLLFPLLMLSFLPLIHINYLRGDHENLFFPIMDMILLTTFYILAIRNKSNVTIHMRYMISIPMVFLSPTVSRIIFFYFTSSVPLVGNMVYGGICLLLIGLILWDILHKRKFQPYVVALTGFSIYLLFYNIIFG